MRDGRRLPRTEKLILRPRLEARELSAGVGEDFELLDLLFSALRAEVRLGSVGDLVWIGSRGIGTGRICCVGCGAARMEIEAGMGEDPAFSTTGLFPSDTGAGPRGLCGAEAELPSSDSISDKRDLDEEEGVILIRKFFAECERETRREFGNLALSDKLLC